MGIFFKQQIAFESLSDKAKESQLLPFAALNKMFIKKKKVKHFD